MTHYPRRSNQIIPSYIPHDLVSRKNGNRGETSDQVKDMLNLQHGRQLAGLGRSEYAGDEEYEDDELSKLEGQDDVVGSGIFDESGDVATVHANMGVFQDHPNLPGYIAREVQFEPNEEIESLPAGADVVTVPGGGMTWGGRIIEGNGPMAPAQPYRKGSQMAPPPSGIVPVRGSAPPAVQMQPSPVALQQTTRTGATMARAPLALPVPTAQQAVRRAPPVATGWRPVEPSGANLWRPVGTNAGAPCPCDAQAPRAPSRATAGLGASETLCDSFDPNRIHMARISSLTGGNSGWMQWLLPIRRALRQVGFPSRQDPIRGMSRWTDDDAAAWMAWSKKSGIMVFSTPEFLGLKEMKRQLCLAPAGVSSALRSSVAKAQGVGASESNGSSMGAYIAGGAIVGVAVALLWGTLGIKHEKAGKR